MIATIFEGDYWSRVKEWLVAVPLFGSAIALTYDVGFFFGIGIEYFSLFSLSEHITFAFQALPLALMAASLIPALPFIYGTVRSLISKMQPDLGTATNESDLERLREIGWQRRSYILMTMAVLGGAITWLGIYLDGMSYVMLGVVMAAASLVIFKFRSMNVMPPILLFALIFITFGIGADAGRKTFHGPQQFILDTGSLIEGTMIRGGERGVLFYDSQSKQLLFQPWDSIKRITSKRR